VTRLRLLDSLGTHLYKCRPLFLLAALVVGPGAQAEVVGGVQLPNGARKVGENRFRAPADYNETLKYFRTVYPPDKYPRRSIVHQPGVKGVHISNPSGKNFEGLNIYEANEEVRIFIVRPAK
jgi:hypothetical protein